MNVTTIPKNPGSLKRRKPDGRGIGPRYDQTSTRGQKGQRSRTGSQKRPGFEGSRTPLIRRIPKRGFRVKSTGREIVREIINVESLNRFRDGEQVTPERLVEAGLIDNASHLIKLLGDGELKKRVSVAIHEASEGAKQKVTQAGGTVELIAAPSLHRRAESKDQGRKPSSAA